MSTNTPKLKRPIAVTFAGWILFIGAVINVVFGVLFLYASGVGAPPQTGPVVIFGEQELDQEFQDREANLIEGVADIVLGVVQLFISIGFWRLWQSAWVLAMSWQALKLLYEIASVLLGGGTLISILFAALLVFLLNQSDVRRAFNIQFQNESSDPVRILDSN